MKDMSNHRGSALLIVLGMMSFMVVSSVAFSMFMRQSRLPSSFLRQRLTASQLVKAGLAGAMQRLDAAIGDNPYPGIGEKGVRQVRFKLKNGNDSGSGIDYGNFWQNRVFMESRLAKDSIGDDDEENLEYDPVATLSLEALAYLPPSLVNTVRYWSKHTTTASWQSLGYDAGRYAFTAVNVSDYFDINHIRANAMRDSSPENRISLGYLFENNDHTGFGAVKPADFDTFMGKVTNDVYRTRLVSLADYNLAVGSGAYGDIGFKSPFWNYFSGGASGDGTFYGSLWETAKRQKFVTDSWFPGDIEDEEADALYLTDNEAQPLEGLGKGLDPLMKNAGEGFNEIKRHLNLAERAALVDYLDEDNVPTSLAMPTMERAPMLTGLQIMPMVVNGPKVIRACDDVETALNENEKEIHRVWKLDTLGEINLMFGGSALYPFKRKFATTELGESTSFNVEVLVKAFLSKESQSLSGTRSTVSYRPASKSDWKEQADMNTGLFTFLTKGSLNVKPCQTENDAFCTWTCDKVQLKLGNGDAKRLYGIKYRMKKNPDNPSIWEMVPDSVQPDDSLVRASPLMLRDAAGNQHPATELVSNFENLKVNIMVWVRVLDGNDTVDLVPATIADDQVYNGMPVPGVSTDLLGEQQKQPIMPVDGPVIELVKDAFKPEADNVEVTVGEARGLRVYCNDPRYNWAPEDWYWAGDNAAISAQGWYDNVKGQFGRQNDRQRDLFQFVSNMGYLQSMGELQFLPLVRTDYNDFSENNAISGSFHQNATRYDGQAFEKRGSINQLVNKNFMWKTRFAFGRRASCSATSKDSEHNPYNWGMYDSRGGAKVSPYADEELMMAALANTPYDYCVASADNGLTLSEGRQYSFGPGSSEARVDWEELLQVAKGIKAEVSTSTDWEDKFCRSERWDDDDGPFGADFGENFHDVDRKFLYSYWRSCFGNTPQLFLIFVRAEPAVMGGSSAGHTPSQLGARAVALVWREAASTIRDQQSSGTGQATYPHRMRILFYHQFE